MERQEVIQNGLQTLLEKRLAILENAASRDGIHEEVISCIIAEHLAEQEGIDIKKYADQRKEMVEKYWRNKK
jgi:hypothetical protein